MSSDDPLKSPMSDDFIKELAQRLAAHLRVELGDRLLPYQRAYDVARQREHQQSKDDASKDPTEGAQ